MEERVRLIRSRCDAAFATNDPSYCSPNEDWRALVCAATEYYGFPFFHPLGSSPPNLSINLYGLVIFDERGIRIISRNPTQSFRAEWQQKLGINKLLSGSRYTTAPRSPNTPPSPPFYLSLSRSCLPLMECKSEYLHPTESNVWLPAPITIPN